MNSSFKILITTVYSSSNSAGGVATVTNVVEFATRNEAIIAANIINSQNSGLLEQRAICLFN